MTVVHGMCFRKNLMCLREFLQDARIAETKPLLCHGIITNPSGRKIVHAWIELRVDFMDSIFDASVEEKWLKAKWYSNYHPESVHRYTLEMAAELAHESDFFGPWEPELLEHQKKIGAPVLSTTKQSRQWMREMFSARTKIR